MSIIPKSFTHEQLEYRIEGILIASIGYDGRLKRARIRNDIAKLYGLELDKTNRIAVRV